MELGTFILALVRIRNVFTMIPNITVYRIFVIFHIIADCNVTKPGIDHYHPKGAARLKVHNSKLITF